MLPEITLLRSTRKISPTKFSLFCLCLLLSLLLAGCALNAGGGGNTSSAASQPTGPTTVRIGWKGSPDSLNPGMGQLTEAYAIYELVYDSLLEPQFDGTFGPGLAEKWENSVDGTVWTFHIRSGMKFHDGQPLTAKDVAFTLNFYKTNIDFPFLNSYTEHFVTAEASDDRTVVLTLDTAIPNIEANLIYLYVLPQHIWQAQSEGTAPTEFLNLAMIGSGPFKMTEYKQNEFVRLAANKQHFATPPKVDEAIFQTFANEDALVQALQTGQVDMITEMPSTVVPTLRKAENVKLVAGPGINPSLSDIIMNQGDPANCPEQGGCTGHPALLDRNVRLALAHATDKQNIIDVVLLGLGEPGLTLIPKGLGLWYNDTLQDYAFDLAQANKILDDAGYKDSDGDGIREMPNGGQPLKFRVQFPNDSLTGPRIAEILGQTWSQIGVKIDPQAIDPTALTDACCPGLDFDIMLWGWASDPDPTLLLSVMATENLAAGSNESGYSNPQYDELYAQQAVTLDKEQRKVIVWEMQKLVFDDVAYIIPYYDQEVQAYRTDRFTGWIDDQPKLALQDVTSLVKIEPVK